MPVVRPPAIWTMRPLESYSGGDLRLATLIFRSIGRGSLYLA